MAQNSYQKLKTKIYPDTANIEVTRLRPLTVVARKHSREARRSRAPRWSMWLRLGPLMLLFGASTALAFDTAKIGQWGTLFLDDLAPTIAMTPPLQREIAEGLARIDKKEEAVRCFGMRFPGPWKHLGGARVSPYACDFGARWLLIRAKVRIVDRRGRSFDTITRTAMKRAIDIRETRLDWTWTTEDPTRGPPWHVRYAE